MTSTRHAHPTAGFTMMELIIVMVVLGVLGTMGAEFISKAFQGFHDTDIRMEIYEEGKTALVRMERELHIALPNALQTFNNGAKTTDTGGNEIRFGEIDDDDTMATSAGRYTENVDADRIEGMPPDTIISIHNTGWCHFDHTADCPATEASRLYISDSAGAIPSSSLDARSPAQRFHAVQDMAVRFAVLQDPADNSKYHLYRGTAQVNAGGALGNFGAADAETMDRLLARDIVAAKDALGNTIPYFTYIPGTSTRNSVVAIHFGISRNNETVTFHKEVQVRNVP